MKLQLFCLAAIGLLSSAAVSHPRDNSTDCHEIQRAENNNYIIQLNCETQIEEFIKEFLDNCDNKSEANGSVKIHRSYDIDGKFKALSVRITNTVVLDGLISRFPDSITRVIPDDEQKFFNVPVAEDIEINNEGPCDWNKTGDPTNFTENTKQSLSSSSSVYRRQNAFGFPSDTVFIAQPDQETTPWNLIRISERLLNLSRPFIYDANAGAGVTVYVLDDGLNVANVDFGGRATFGWSAFENSNIAEGNQAAREGGGHGTHVAGIIGGTHYGVAKNVSLVGVQVLKVDGTGTISDLLGGLQYVANQQQGKAGLALINMSLGISRRNAASDTFDDAVLATIAAGVGIVAAAGNAGQDACEVTPAYLPSVFTVGVTTENDVFDNRSNFGSCVNVLAPGVNITSDYIGSDYATSVMSGSSMSAPHATGVAALILPYLQTTTVEGLWDALSSIATRGVVKDITDPGTPNALVFNGQGLTIS
ncbi:peptidase S8/S53 domain-containing protein [Dichotomocladium elegans]|nr:peptidase S8/S53 domain-containing protein [Dichotomocladium elegans]